MQGQAIDDASSSENIDVDASNESDDQLQPQGEKDDGPSISVTRSSQPPNSSIPTQKRRRVTRACDECRRKKIKCDGRQPCTHCTVYSYECTYDQPSHRRRNLAPHYVDALEGRLQRAEALLRKVLPDVDLDDPNFSNGVPQRMMPRIKQEPQSQSSMDRNPSPIAGQARSADPGSMLESMLQNTGSLDLDDRGHWDFHGTSSGIVFLRALRDQFGDLMGQAEGYGMPFLKTRTLASPVNSPKSAESGPSLSDAGLPNKEDLPPKDCAVLLAQCALDDACALMRFVHQPTFWAKFERAYDTPADQYRDSETRFLPLLYSVVALGALFAKADRSQLQQWGYENAIDQGFTWFDAARSMVDITDCRDLTSLQTVLFMILFLQSSSRLSTCYSYIGVVLRSSIRMGLHRSVAIKFNPIEGQIRQRIFWTVRKMDAYTGALLGLPNLLSEEDIDQEMPLEVDDEYITSEKILPMPDGHLSLMTAVNAHTRLVKILLKIVRYIYPIKADENRADRSYAVSHKKVREIEQDLQQWMEGLPMALRPGSEAPPDIARVQQLLRMAYAHIQMILYRPFLHYISQKVQAKSIDKRYYACAAACVSVSRNIIHIASEMKRRGLLNGSYWFYMYTTFFAVLSLVFFVIENPSSTTAKEILRDANEGRDTLASLAKRSMAADRCTQTLARLFEQLPEKLKGVRAAPVPQKKRQASALQNNKPSRPEISAQSAPTMKQTVDWKEMSGQRAKSSPNSSDASQNHPPDAREPSTLRQQAVPQPRHGLDAQSGSYDPFSPSHTNTHPLNSASGTPSSGAWSMPGPQHHSTADLPNFNAMMFPSADPLAYPNQPMTLFERQDPDAFNPILFDPGNTTPATTPSNESIDARLFGPMPPYLMQGQYAGFGWQHIDSPMPLSLAPGGDSAMAMDGHEGPWSSQNMQREGDGPIFGDGWGQPWMSQSYRQ